MLIAVFLSSGLEGIDSSKCRVSSIMKASVIEASVFRTIAISLQSYLFSIVFVARIWISSEIF